MTPFTVFRGRAFFHKKKYFFSSLAVDANDAYVRQMLVAGFPLTADQPRGAVVTEYLLYQLGVSDEADMESVVGQTLRLEFSSQPDRVNNLVWLLGGDPSDQTPTDDELFDKIVRQLPATVHRLDLTEDEKNRFAELFKRRGATRKTSAPVYFSEDFTIAGVVRIPTEKEMRETLERMKAYADVFLPAATSTELYFRVPNNREEGVNSAVVRVDSEDNVKEVNERISDMGLDTYAPIEFLEGMRLNARMISLTTAFVAVVALVLAGLSITNTLLMSVLERTHEIGIMKAV